MPINWFTVIAQTINFFILVWLLKRFLYKPILDAIDQREKGIATQLAQAEAKVAEAELQREAFQRKNQAFDQERRALLKHATDEAKAERERLLDQARKDADLLRAGRLEVLRAEQRTLSQEIVRRTHDEVFAITRKTLADLASTSLEERMREVFVEHLRALSGDAKEQLAAVLKSSPHKARVRTAFNLGPAEQSAIERAVKETLGVETEIQFEVATDLISGIELSTNGFKIAWSIADYLRTLKTGAAELLQEEANGQLA